MLAIVRKEMFGFIFIIKYVRWHDHKVKNKFTIEMDKR
jgi:hypothetical protein